MIPTFTFQQGIMETFEVVYSKLWFHVLQKIFPQLPLVILRSFPETPTISATHLG